MEWLVGVGIIQFGVVSSGECGEQHLRIQSVGETCGGTLVFLTGCRLRTWGQFSGWQLLHVNLNQLV